METQRELFAAAIDIRQWLESDASRPIRERTSRDREIGREIRAGRTADRVLEWWRRIGTDASEGEGERLAALVSIANGLLLVAGVLTGLGIAGATFAYQGDHPVNLFALIGILVAVPLVMLMLQLTFVRSGAPLPASIRDALAVLSPARWAGTWLQRHLGRPLFESVASRSRSGFARWQLLVFSQSFAIGFFAGVLLMAGLLVVFTDLAFGWSTTLNIEAEQVQTLVGVIAFPWHQFLPVAVPDASLVETSRYFRLEAPAVSAERASRLGGWWPFVVMTIVVWGLLPRLLVAGIAARQLRRQTRRLLEEGPEIAGLLDRLTAPRVDFEGSAASSGIPAPGSVPRSVPGSEMDLSGAIVVWNEAIDDEALGRLLARHGARDATSIAVSESEGAAGQNEALARLPDAHRVVVLTKGWEPPLLSFVDFLGRLRERLGEGALIVVVPLDAAGNNVDTRGREVWATALARSDDAGLYVAEAG